jgi:UDP:flavonoid glycosyltransferase YjiC (YdhE family)
MSDAVLARKLNTLRRELGLSPVRRVVTEWWNSPDLVVGMFPDWFQPPAPDWPAQTFLPGFALYEPEQEFEEEPELEAFLDAGEPPVVFGQGSWIQGAEEYFRSSVAAAQALGLRAILLTPHVEQVPSKLPEGMLHLKFVPYSRVLPRSAAIVHHGGTGSLASGLAAGIPQLVCPRVGDQPANAQRLTRLGVAESVAPRRYTSATVGAALQRLLSSPTVADACVRFAETSRTMRTFPRIADRVEGL